MDNTTDPLFTLTPKAAEYAKRLLDKEGINSPPGGIRFSVKAGGCSGLECVHKLERTDANHDIIILSHGVRVLIDPKSMTQLKGIEIDHAEDLTKKPFIVNSPNTCGCGISFQPKEDKEKK